MNMFDEARSILAMIKLGGMTQERAASVLGKSQPYVANKLRLLDYSKKAEELITEYALSERHARTILRLDNEEDRLDAIDRAHKMKMNVERCEIMVDSILDDKLRSLIPKGTNYQERIGYFERSLETSISLLREVGIRAYAKRDEDGGKIYFSVCIG